MKLNNLLDEKLDINSGMVGFDKNIPALTKYLSDEYKKILFLKKEHDVKKINLYPYNCLVVDLEETKISESDIIYLRNMNTKFNIPIFFLNVDSQSNSLYDIKVINHCSSVFKVTEYFSLNGCFVLLDPIKMRGSTTMFYIRMFIEDDLFKFKMYKEI